MNICEIDENSWEQDFFILTKNLKITVEYKLKATENHQGW